VEEVKEIKPIEESSDEWCSQGSSPEGIVEKDEFRELDDEEALDHGDAKQGIPSKYRGFKTEQQDKKRLP
jgi:hypothetical protein